MVLKFGGGGDGDVVVVLRVGDDVAVDVSGCEVLLM